MPEEFTPAAIAFPGDRSDKCTRKAYWCGSRGSGSQAIKIEKPAHIGAGEAIISRKAKLLRKKPFANGRLNSQNQAAQCDGHRHTRVRGRKAERMKKRCLVGASEALVL